MESNSPDEHGSAPEDAAPTAAEADVESAVSASDEVAAEMMHLLHEGVPLALIADLATPGGPDSPEILAEEGLPDVDWLGDVEREPADLDELDDAVKGELADETE